MNVSCAGRTTANGGAAEPAGEVSNIVAAPAEGEIVMKKDKALPFQWPEETVIEYRSDEDLARIDEVFDPLLEASNGEVVRAPLHVVVSVDSVESLKKAVSQFNSFGDEVTTFEFRFTAPVDNSEEEIHLHQVVGVSARLILSGVGDSPVRVSMLRFDLQADVIQIHNLAWSGGNLPMSLVRAKTGKFFEMKDVMVSDNYYNVDQEPDASPMFDLEPSAQADSKVQVHFENVSFINNKVHSLVAISRRGAGVEVQKQNVTFQNNVCFPGSCYSIE